MEKYKWTDETDKVIFEMISVGASVADICDRLGCKDTQLKNHVAVLRRKDPSFPTLCGGESSGKKFSLDENRGDGEPTVVEAEQKAAELNPLEREMADIITENNAIIEALLEELDIEKAARAEEAQAYQREIAKLTTQRDGLREVADGYVAEIHEKDEALKKVYAELDRALTEQIRERDEVIFSMAKAIFMGPKGVSLA